MRTLLVCCCLLAFPVLAAPPSARGDDPALDPLVKGLLALEAPARDWKAVSKRTRQPRPRVPWIMQMRQAVEEEPEKVVRYFGYVQPDAAMVRAVGRLAEGDPERARFDADWHEAVDAWLAIWRPRRLPAYRAELVAAVRRVHSDDMGIEGKEDVEALAAADWDLAVSVLEELRRHRDARVRAYATSFRYSRAAGDARVRLREDLRRIAETRGAPGYARQLALETLRTEDWPGRDAWLLSLFEDPTLRELHDGSILYRPLAALVAADRETWIPRIVPLVGGASRAAHDNAVAALVQFHLDDARRDALEPLLPWLADPAWSSASDRLRLIQSVADLDLREAVPGLIAVVEREDGWPLRAAVKALAHLRPPEAAPVLRQALLRVPEDMRRRVWHALRACGGLDLETRVEARIAHALRLDAEQGPAAAELGPPSEAARLGACIARMDGRPPADVSEFLLQRAGELEATHLVAAARLREWVGPWPRVHPHQALLDRLAAGRLEAEALAEVLRGERPRVADRFAETLRALIEKGGTAGGVAAFLLDDDEFSSALLAGKDASAQMAFLACARLVRHEIALGRIARLFEAEHEGLHHVAEAYLRALDTPAARKIVWARHPGEALLLGRPGYQTGTWEEQLRVEVLAPDGPDEIIALLSHGAWGPKGQVVVRVKADKATLAFHHRKADDIQRPLPAERLAELREHLWSIEADTLPAYEPPISDGVHYTFVRLTRDGGYRIYMNNPGNFLDDREQNDVYARLVDFMRGRLWREE